MTVKEQFSQAYQKNAEKMMIIKAKCEAARKRGDRVQERKYRAEYIELKSEIDTYAIELIK